MAKDRELETLAARRKGILKTIARMQDILPGNLAASYLPCNKGNCKCARGELHGPKWTLTWKEEGKTKTLYIRQAEVAEVRKETENYGKAKGLLRQAAQINLELFKMRRARHG
ncbi:hypothetical protein HKBW3S44_01335 [Candidatus Hakubella thermalkaliphila]|uniref:DUF6788 domain-containing protein n=1 Tax=Candidatus Hakubella thermalkaliphila TaxID=2754717 RepID=A0A6V8NU84_9ACTN|nr:DUF6788 family protein [Candidatus Hakubella thermalkaliphila]GFP23848.1 hypothetical protein HKBW3S09_01313 [Candidatus Hakubella thermalkaliphila]GFP31203.1 hypothetical protein HKBW3S34_02122 [Candidatus Hakubella thermalkaliphila]GFP37658.1 hypothetical protein HKBW3S44_01335 [Candidatus Hakubella thermalkaliphila]GFP40484.1 hypothetical protein HKBW3S47_02181 [Candidatus Hakubella thermalkaliphila]GFP41138.1 hypothetical protein HKBW3C_00264 [Candidatus Hakubella thermalkaliphila]